MNLKIQIITCSLILVQFITREWYTYNLNKVLSSAILLKALDI